MKKKQTWLGALTVGVLLSGALASPLLPSAQASASDGGVRRVDSYFSAENATFTTDADLPSYVHSGGNGVRVVSKDGGVLRYENVVDLSEYTKEDTLCKIQFTPQTMGVAEFNQLEIRIEDYTNPKIYIDVVVYRYPYGTANDANQSTISMVSAKPNSISSYSAMQYKVQDGTAKGTVQTTKEQGSMIYVPFAGARGTHSEAFELFYDAKELALYTKNSSVWPTGILTEQGIADDEGKYLFLDMDDPAYMGIDKANLWGGFTDGRVKISFEATGVYESMASYTVLEIANQTMDGTYINDVTAPKMSVDLQGYTKGALPDAVVGRGYPLFDVTARDAMYGEIAGVRRNVYYGNELVYFLGDSFVPDKAGEYTLEYIATDGNNNSAVQTFTVTAKEAVTPMQGSIDRNSVYGSVLDLQNANLYNERGGISWGLYYKVRLPKMQSTGGSGRVVCTTLVTFEGNEIPLQDNGFIPTKQGRYTVTYKLVDYLGNVKTYDYYLDVAYTEIPQMSDVSVIDYMTVGKSYYLEPVQSKLYTKWYQALATYDKITVYKEDGSVITQFIGKGDAFYTPSEGDGSKVIVEYFSAKNEGAQGVTVREEVLLLPDTSLTDRIVADENVTLSSTNSAIELSFASEEESAQFINPLLTEGGLTLKFDIASADGVMKNNFERIALTLTDSKDARVQTTIFFAKNPNANAETSFVTIDGITKEIQGSFYGNVTSNFYITVYTDGSVLNINGDLIAKIGKNDFQESFTGFPSGKVFVKFSLQGITGAAGIQLMQFRNQMLGSYEGENYDYAKPVLHVYNEPLSQIALGEKIQISKAVGGDVYNTQTSVTVSLTDEAENVLYKSVAANGAFAGDEYLPTAYGKYYLHYEVRDANGNRATRDYAITVKDFVNPTLTLTGELPTQVNLGEIIQLPTATAKDNCDARVDVYCIVLDPMYLETMKPASELTSFKAEWVGRYVVYYYAVDDNYNFVFSQKYYVQVG